MAYIRLAALAILALLAAPLPAEAQQTKTLPRIALVMGTGPVAEMLGSDPVHPNVRAFVHGMRDLGYVEGRNVLIERRSAEGKTDRLPDLFRELVRSNVDVIVTATHPVALAAKRATSTIPIVIAVLATDPVELGLAESLARPGGNVTGRGAAGGYRLEVKMLELLTETVPKASRVAFLYPTPWLEGRPAATEFKDQFSAADALRITLLPVGVDSPERYPQAFATMAQQRADALLVRSTGFNFAHRKIIVDLATRHRLPSISMFSDAAKLGGLMAYGASIEEDFRRAATICG